MTFWQFLDRQIDRLPGWPHLSERAWVTIATFVLAGSMLKMAEVHQQLWNVELFKTLLTLVIGTAIVNMILAFHFTANKSDEAKADNTGAGFRAMEAMALAQTDRPSGKPNDPVHVEETPRNGL